MARVAAQATQAVRRAPMTINPKRTAALERLAATGIWRSNYAPPVLRALWWAGIDVPPPHFVSFRGNAISNGAVFFVTFGLARWFIEGYDYARSLRAVLLEHTVLSVLFGLLMAAVIERAKRKYKLPNWRGL